MEGDLWVRIGIIVAILAVLWVLPDWGAYRERTVRIGRSLGLVQPAPPVPSGEPIERIAADARRIRSQIRSAPSGTPVAKLRGWREAYDDVLIAACHALDLEERLGELPEGTQRDLERERVERLLEATGLLLRPSA